MPTNKVVIEAQKLESCGTSRKQNNSVQVKILQVPGKCGPITTSGVLKGGTISAPVRQSFAALGHQPPSSTLHVPGPQTSPSDVMVVAKAATSRGVGTNGLPHITKPVLNQGSSVNPTSSQGRTVVITVPRASGPQPVTVAPPLTQIAPAQLPASIQIPSGAMLIHSESGQLMLVSQQALAQAHQGPRTGNGQAPRLLPPQVSAAAGSKSNEKPTVIRMAAPPTFQPAPVQKTAVVKVISVTPKPAVVKAPCGVVDQGKQSCFQSPTTKTEAEPPPTFSQETLESVKKCKNFLVTLMKLAASGSKSVNMASNVIGLVRRLLEGKLEAEEFTEELYRELKSTPQPCLVPFLKKSLPAVRCLTADPQFFIQQVITSISNPTMKQTGTLSMKQQFSHNPLWSTNFPFKGSSGSYREDDDINDVASMAGVNLKEENAQILTSMVGTVLQSCQDLPFLSPSLLLSRILHTGQAQGVPDVGSEVVALVSHATQKYLRGLLEKLTTMAEHRKMALKMDLWHTRVSDVRSQFHFLEEVESFKKKRTDEEERERLLRLARRRSHTEDPQYQLLKQRAKELQQIEKAQLQQREANITALAAIGPRKRPLTQTASQVSLPPKLNVQRVTRVMLKDLLVCMEQDRFLQHSLTLYKAMQ
ncbi:transcription initiation factor TFIID subunit 4-like [Aulostomus maculatus]